MKKLIIIALLAVSTTAYGAGFFQQDASQQTKIQGFAPNGKKTQSLTLYRSGTVNNTTDLAWSVYAPADCSFRIQSTATRAGIVCTAPGGTWTTRIVNSATPFTTFSGCTSGVLQRQ